MKTSTRIALNTEPKKWRWFMNRRRISAISLITVALVAVYSKTHQRQPYNPYTAMQAPFYAAGDTSRPAPGRAAYSPDQVGQMDQDSQAYDRPVDAAAARYDSVSYDPANSGAAYSSPADSNPAASRPAVAGAAGLDTASWTRQ